MLHYNNFFYHYLNLNDLKINKLIKDNNFIQKANLSNKNLIRNHSSINLYKNKCLSVDVVSEGDDVTVGRHNWKNRLPGP